MTRRIGQRARARLRLLRDAFLTDPTHFSLGSLGIVIAFGLAAATQHPGAFGPIPSFLVWGWAAGLAVSGVGKIIGPIVFISCPERQEDGRAIILGASILAASTWLTLAVGLLFIPGGVLAFLQALALGLGAVGRAVSIHKTDTTVKQAISETEGGTRP